MRVLACRFSFLLAFAISLRLSALGLTVWDRPWIFNTLSQYLYNGFYEAISCRGGGIFKLQELKVVFKVNAGYGDRINTKPMLQKPVSVSNNGICPFHNGIVAPKDWSKALTATMSSMS